MIYQYATSLATALYARKGEALPSPAVGYVSITQLEAWTNDQSAPASLHLVGGPDVESSAGDPGVPLSSLIHRHRPCSASATLSAPANDTTTAAWDRAERQGATIDLMRYLSVPSAHAIGDAGGAEADATPPSRPAPRLKRKQLTLRLDYDAFRVLRNISYSEDVTYQSLLEAAVRVYLETLDTASAAEAG